MTKQQRQVINNSGKHLMGKKLKAIGMESGAGEQSSNFGLDSSLMVKCPGVMP